MLDPTDILEIISKLSDRHVLKGAPAGYATGFAEAVLRVYPAKDLKKILQDKFFIPNDTAFNLDTYCQSASELSIQNHLVLDQRLQKVAIEKQVNPPKDVDAYYEIGSTRVSLEVKCAVEQSPPESALIYKTAGRVPGHVKSFDNLKEVVGERDPDKKVFQGKNKDNTMKDFLLSAHSKFSSKPGFEDLNILFVACGDYFNVQEWWFYLFLNNGLFTKNSFYPPSEFGRVDLVILSNLKYCHAVARASHNWRLDDVFLLPALNPNRRKSALSATMFEGINIFSHHLKSYSEYVPRDDDPDANREIALLVKVNSYVVDGLAYGDRERYFPTIDFESPSLKEGSPNRAPRDFS